MARAKQGTEAKAGWGKALGPEAEVSGRGQGWGQEAPRPKLGGGKAEVCAHRGLRVACARRLEQCALEERRVRQVVGVRA